MSQSQLAKEEITWPGAVTEILMGHQYDLTFMQFSGFYSSILGKNDMFATLERKSLNQAFFKFCTVISIPLEDYILKISLWIPLPR